jgi:hypothetical protein
MSRVDLDLEHRTPAELALARRVRQVARIVAAAGLPAVYRPTAFALLLDRELDELDGDGDVQAAA